MIAKTNDPIRVCDKHSSSSVARYMAETGHKIDLNFFGLYKCSKAYIKVYLNPGHTKTEDPHVFSKRFIHTLNQP